MVLKNFAVFEGIDGAGTSTQIELLKKRKDQNFFFTAEPTAGETGKFLRRILSGQIEVSPQAVAYLFAADRAQHLWGAGGILEQCQNKKIVVCDRYIFSSLAYQGALCGEQLPRIINSLFPLPEFLFYFDIATHISLLRIESRAEKKEIYENEKMLEQTALRYKKIIDEFKKAAPEMKIVQIDATQSKEKIAQIVWDNLRRKI